MYMGYNSWTKKLNNLQQDCLCYAFVIKLFKLTKMLLLFFKLPIINILNIHKLCALMFKTYLHIDHQMHEANT